MSRKVFFFIFMFIFSLPFSFVKANVLISEVELSPTTDRFIELYNNGDANVDLTGWYIQRKTATGASFGSLVSAPNFEGKSIISQGYFVISKEGMAESDLVVNMSLTDSNTLQLKNSFGDVVDKVGWGESDECQSSCPANPAEGQSIQRIDNSWVVATPTPGVVNNSGSPSSNNVEQSSGGSDGGSTVSTTTVVKEEVKEIATEIITKNVVFVGTPFTIEAKSYGHSGERLYYGKYFWNFGDGDSRETLLINNEKFTHTFYYPGTYTINLEYYNNPYDYTPTTIDEVKIKVVKGDIIISDVGDSTDFYVELSNNTDYSSNISGWLLLSDNKVFKFPKNTSIQAKGKMIVSSKITNLDIGDKDSLKLMNDQGVVFDYASTNTPPEPVASKSTARIITPVKNVEIKVLEPVVNNNDNDEEIISLNASALDANKEDPKSSEGGENHLIILMFSTLLILSGSGVYYLRQKGRAVKLGEDFDILDE